MPDSQGSILLGEVAAHLAILEIGCTRCPRKGKVGVDRLMADYGPTLTIPTLLAIVSADRPKRLAGKCTTCAGVICRSCQAYF